MGNESKGLEKLKAAVIKDCNDGEGCFNPNGCDHEFYRTVPQDNPRLREMGFETATKCVSKCTHKYCDKYKWVIERAKHYAEITGLDYEDFINSWEEDRSYWYMNYYQDCNQPKLNEGNSLVKIFETVEDAKASISGKGFRCPSCGGISKNPYKCDTGIVIENGNKVCDWASYGLLGTLGKGAYLLVKDKMKVQELFMPVAWETST